MDGSPGPVGLLIGGDTAGINDKIQADPEGFVGDPMIDIVDMRVQ